MLRKPRIFEAILELETLFEEFRILHDFSEVKAATIKLGIFFSLTTKLTCLREEASDYLLMTLRYFAPAIGMKLRFF